MAALMYIALCPFIVAVPPVELSRMPHWRTEQMCGVNCAYLVLTMHGYPCTYEQIANEVTVGVNGSNIASIGQCLSDHGLENTIVRTSPNRLRSRYELPGIVHLGDDTQSGHFVVLVSIDDHVARCIDGSTGSEVVIPLGEFNAAWSGVGLFRKTVVSEATVSCGIVAVSCILLTYLLEMLRRALSRRSCATIVVAGCVGWTSPSFAEDIASIADAVQEHYQRLSSLSVTYDVSSRSLITEQELHAHLGIHFLENETHTFAFKDDKRLFAFDRKDKAPPLIQGADARAAQWIQHQVQAFNGDRKVSLSRDSQTAAIVTRRGSSGRNDLSYFNQTYLQWAMRTLPDALGNGGDRAQERLSDALRMGQCELLGKEVIDGHECVNIRVQNRKVWCDPKVGWGIRKWHDCYPEQPSLQASTFTLSDYEERSGVWLPMKATQIRYGPIDGPAALRNTPCLEYTLVVTSIGVNNVDDDLFVIDIPPNTLVSDYTLSPSRGGVVYSYPADPKDLPATIAAALKSHGTSGTSVLISPRSILAINAVIVCGVAILVWRRRRAKTLVQLMYGVWMTSAGAESICACSEIDELHAYRQHVTTAVRDSHDSIGECVIRYRTYTHDDKISSHHLFFDGKVRVLENVHYSRDHLALDDTNHTVMYFDGSVFGVHYVASRYREESRSRERLDFAWKIRLDYILLCLGWWPHGDDTPPNAKGAPRMFLRHIVDNDQYKLGREDLDGTACTTLTMGEVDKVWLDEAHGYAIIKRTLQGVTPKGDLVTTTYDCRDFRMVPGSRKHTLWYPQCITRSEQRNDDGVLHHVECVIDDIQMHRDDCLACPPPCVPGMILVDRDSGKQTLSPGGRELLDDAAVRATRKYHFDQASRQPSTMVIVATAILSTSLAKAATCSHRGGRTVVRELSSMSRAAQMM